jgi:hypothetical protein
LFRFVAGLTGCGIEPLEDLGKAIVASVQQIAFRDLEQPTIDGCKLLINNNNQSSVVLERHMHHRLWATYTLDTNFKVKLGKEKILGGK